MLASPSACDWSTHHSRRRASQPRRRVGNHCLMAVTRSASYCAIFSQYRFSAFATSTIMLRYRALHVDACAGHRGQPVRFSPVEAFAAFAAPAGLRLWSTPGPVGILLVSWSREFVRSQNRHPLTHNRHPHFSQFIFSPARRQKHD